MQETRALRWLRTGGAAVAALSFVVATLWDIGAYLAGAAVPPSAGAVFTYMLVTAGVFTGCVAVLLRVLQRRAWRGTAAARLRRVTALELLAIGLMLGALVLRGHREIPPDPPLLGAQVFALAALLAADWLRRRTLSST